MIPIIDPMDALAAVNKAVKMVKMAASTTDNVASLGPLIGNYFDAKHTATQAARQAKKSGGSNMGKAIEIEMALKSQADFEKQLEGLFFSANCMDTWFAIKQRVAEMDAADKEEARLEKLAAEKRAREMKQLKQAVFAGLLALVLITGIFGGFVKLMMYCHENGCG